MTRLALFLLLVDSAYAVDWNAIADGPHDRLTTIQPGFDEKVVVADRCRNPECDCNECDCRRNCKCKAVKTRAEPVAPTKERSATFVSYSAVDRAAKSRGGYRPGQRVVISIGQTEAINLAWQQHCNLNGWTFCVHDHAQPGLDVGVSQHEADARGQLHPVFATVPVTQFTDSAAHDSFAPSQSTDRYFATELQVFSGGAFASGTCSQGVCH